jgi:hypothetical protein
VSHPAWSFREGQAVSAELQVDDGASFSGKGVAFGEMRAAFGIDGTAANYQLFRRGRRLHVRLDGQPYDFFLEGSAKALSTLINCVDAYTAVAQAPAEAAAEKQSGHKQPSQAQPKNKQSEVASSAPAQTETKATDPTRTAQRLEATEIATNIAADAGLQGFRVINDQEQRKKAGNPDVLWVAGSLIGSANIIDDVPDLTIDEVAAVRAAQVTGCDREKSTAAKRENLDGVATVSTLIRCVDANDKPIVIDNTLIERRTGVFFEFELIYANADGSGSEESAAGVGAQVKDAVLTVLKPQ